MFVESAGGTYWDCEVHMGMVECIDLLARLGGQLRRESDVLQTAEYPAVSVVVIYDLVVDVVTCADALRRMSQKTIIELAQKHVEVAA